MIVQFAGAVTAVQARLIALDDTAVALRPIGADGTAEHVLDGDVVALACADGVDAPAASTVSTL